MTTVVEQSPREGIAFSPPPVPSAPMPFHPSLRSLAFCSCYIYSPRGMGYGSALARLICLRLKRGDPAWLPTYAGAVRALVTQRQLPAKLFGKETVFVPVPGSAVSTLNTWPAERLATVLRGIGLGASVWSALRRRQQVRKSATAFTADRPTVAQHYESFAVVPTLRPPEHIVLVDDVVTKGRTLFAAAARLQGAFPNADIRAFALVRTVGFRANVLEPLEPCQGVIRWAGGDARRDP